MSHLGPRVSALLDGQLSGEESARAWSHVRTCGTCRDLVERESWVKGRLASLCDDARSAAPGAPATLKGTLSGLTPGDVLRLMDTRPAAAVAAPRPARLAGLSALGGGAVGAAVVGVLALGVAPADAPSGTLRPPPARTAVAPAGAGATSGRSAASTTQYGPVEPASLIRRRH